MKFNKLSAVSLLTASILTLTLAACSDNSSGKVDGNGSNSSPSATSTETVETAAEFPFKKGNVDIKEFTEKVGTSNQAIKTLKVKTTSEQTVEGETSTVVTEGVVDQTDPQVLKYRFTNTIGDSETEVIRIGDDSWTKNKDGSWSKQVGVLMGSGVSTSTSLFTELGEIEGGIEKIVYEGDDSDSHKFVMTINLDKMTGEEGPAFGSTDSVFWLNDDFQMVKQEMTLESPFGKSHLISEQSEFNEPVDIEVPENVVSPSEIPAVPEVPVPTTVES